MDINTVVGRNIRKYRDAAGLSQDELADRAAIHTTYLSGVENGRRNITLNVLARLAEALAKTEEDLVRRP